MLDHRFESFRRRRDEYDAHSLVPHPNLCVISLSMPLLTLAHRWGHGLVTLQADFPESMALGVVAPDPAYDLSLSYFSRSSSLASQSPGSDYPAAAGNAFSTCVSPTGCRTASAWEGPRFLSLLGPQGPHHSPPEQRKYLAYRAEGEPNRSMSFPRPSRKSMSMQLREYRA